MGPFIDADHPDVTGCSIDRPFEEAFEEIIEKIASHLENLSTRIVLVPSLRDVVHDYVFPQPPLELNAKLRQFTNVECVPNPAMIRINGVSFGLISNDVLKHMMSQVAYKEPKVASGAAPTGGSERVSSLSQHVINQRSFYPVRPSPSASSGECQLDFAQWSKCDLPYTPDVLLFVSSLPTFVKQYGDTLCANVGRLVTGKTAGTYMELNINASTGLPSEAGAGIGARSSAAVVRI
jgi:DNA polymerase alpha subunit B